MIIKKINYWKIKKFKMLWLAVLIEFTEEIMSFILDYQKSINLNKVYLLLQRIGRIVFLWQEVHLN
jgi:hypothetical protein